MDLLDQIGAVFTLIGALFFLLSAVGLLRMPDSYNRIQAGTKATTLGSILFMIGLAMIHPEWTTKLIILVLFILLTNPISSNVLSRTAHFIKVKLTDKTVVDRLTEDEEKLAEEAE